jgi:hypothetical protein
MTEINILLASLDPFIRIGGLAIIAIGIYWALMTAFDAWVQSPPRSTTTKTGRILQDLEAGYMTPDDARRRLRVEVANGEVIFYSTCRLCNLAIVEGDTQLQAWQAYVRHFTSRHG